MKDRIDNLVAIVIDVIHNQSGSYSGSYFSRDKMSLTKAIEALFPVQTEAPSNVEQAEKAFVKNAERESMESMGVQYSKCLGTLYESLAGQHVRHQRPPGTFFPHTMYSPDGRKYTLRPSSAVGDNALYYSTTTEGKKCCNSFKHMLTNGFTVLPPKKTFLDLTDKQILEVCHLAVWPGTKLNPNYKFYKEMSQIQVSPVVSGYGCSHVTIGKDLDITFVSDTHIHTPNNQYKIQSLFREWGIEPVNDEANTR